MDDIIAGREAKPKVAQFNTKFLAPTRAKQTLAPSSSNLAQDKTKLANNLFKLYLESKREIVD